MSSYHTYLEGWRQREQRRAKETHERAARAMACAKALAAMLYQQYRVRRVLLVGSLARGDFRFDSDIDLVVDGLPTDQLFAAGSQLEAHAGDFRVDLVPLESATPDFAHIVQHEGVLL